MKQQTRITAASWRGRAALCLLLALTFLAHDLGMTALATGTKLQPDGPAIRGGIAVEHVADDHRAGQRDLAAHHATREAQPMSSPCEISGAAVLAESRPPVTLLPVILADPGVTMLFPPVAPVSRSAAAAMPTARERRVAFQVFLI